MTLKHWALVCGAVACLNSISISAAPWIDPGDARARFAAQKLADRGHLDRTVTTWPLMWSAVHSGLAESAADDYRSVGMASAYLRFEKERQANPGFRAEYTLSGSSEPTAINGFSGGNTSKAETSFNVQWQGEHWALGVSPAYAYKPEDDERWRFDGSYLAATAGNWVFGAGAIDRWWGPGWQSSLILSNNARPMPGVWINRADAAAPESAWLNWIGPWQLTLFASHYEHERYIPDTKLLGMRLTVRPVTGLDIGFSRAIMVGGGDRPEDGSTLWNAFIGRDNGQLGEDDPGNQLAAVDIRYGFPIGAQSMGLYAQMMGEDEAGAFPARKSWLLGSDWTSQFLGSDQQWFVEYANTLADDFMGTARPNITYDHSIYKSGYRYYGRALATSFDGDAEVLTAGLFNFFDNGSNASINVSYADLNIDGISRTAVPDKDIFYTVPAGHQKASVVNIGYGTPLLHGWLDLNLQATDKKIDYISGTKDQLSLSARWRYRF
ncbi:MAG TPA: capsule assembly Wzi family protein [Marinobacter sp.]|nr:capsule assembly Wzi family protein [Marinobacter sp.]